MYISWAESTCHYHISTTLCDRKALHGLTSRVVRRFCARHAPEHLKYVTPYGHRVYQSCRKHARKQIHRKHAARGHRQDASEGRQPIAHSTGLPSGRAEPKTIFVPKISVRT